MGHGGAKPGAHHHSEAAFTDIAHTDADAIHDDTAGEINAITAKTTPASGDLFLIEDSAASNAKKKVQYTNMPAVGSSADLVHGESGHDDGHDTVSNNWNSASDTEEWNHALTVAAGDLIVVEWVYVWDGMSTGSDPEVKVVLDDGTTEFPSGAHGAQMFNADEGYMVARWMFIVESTSLTQFYSTGMSADIIAGLNAPDIVDEFSTSADTRGYYGTTTSDYTGSVTVRGYTLALGTNGEYYEEYVYILHIPQTT